MKITKKQLRRIIREVLSESFGPMGQPEHDWDDPFIFQGPEPTALPDPQEEIEGATMGTVRLVSDAWEALEAVKNGETVRLKIPESIAAALLKLPGPPDSGPLNEAAMISPDQTLVVVGSLGAGMLALMGYAVYKNLRVKVSGKHGNTEAEIEIGR